MFQNVETIQSRVPSYPRLQQTTNGGRVNFGMPSVDEQLTNLMPSRELTEYYRKKIAQYDVEQEEIVQKLDEYRRISNDRHKLEEEVLKRGEKIFALQKALSELQNCLFHERDHVLHMYAENDRLKMIELEDRKKIQKLLAMTGQAKLQDKVIYVLEDPPHNVAVCQRKETIDKDQTKVKQLVGEFQKKPCSLTLNSKTSNVEVDALKAQVSALQAQLDEQTKLSKDHAHAMAEDIRVTFQEAEAQSLRDAEKIKYLSDKLRQTEELLQLSTRDFLELKKKLRRKEIRWKTEKTALIQNLNYAVKNVGDKEELETLIKEVTTAIEEADSLMKKNSKSDAHIPNAALISKYDSKPKSDAHITTAALISKDDSKPKSDQKESSSTSTDKHESDKSEQNAEIKNYTRNLKVLEQELKEAKTSIKTYQNQCLQMEENLNSLRDEHEAMLQVYKNKSESQTKQLQTAKARLQKLERYRKLEVEGFKTDIKNLKQKIKEMEKQLMKAVLLFEQGEKDMDLLRTVHSTTIRSKRVADEIKALKAKLYQLENDLRLL